MKYLVGLVLGLSSIGLFAQTTISGVVNTYATVTDITGADLTITAQRGASHSFGCGDAVVVLQMAGADHSTALNASFGDLTALNAAGTYEWPVVESVTGSVITLAEPLTRSYTTDDVVQLIHVPSYGDAEVTGAVLGEPWNGQSGGVVALNARGTLTLSADIDASGIGFRGGSGIDDTRAGISDFCFFNLIENGCVGTGYAYPASTAFAVEKGESISEPVAGQEHGRGHRVHGGGGGGVESGGGGGGGHAGAGGRGGGCNFNSCFCDCSRSAGDYNETAGIGGSSLIAQYSNALDRVVLGGGGGGGNNGNASQYYILPNRDGMPGGGIILLRADTVEGAGGSIVARGESGYVDDGSTDMFGTGGGGGGGAVLAEVDAWSAVAIDVSGGKGSDARSGSGGANRRRGAGGGGGGGIAWLSGPSLPPGVTVTDDGGAGGLSYNTAGRQPGHDGQPGLKGGTIFGLDMPGRIPVTTAPTVNQQPADQTVNAGDPASFAVQVQEAGVGYQWQVDAGSGFVDLADDATYAGTESPVLDINTTGLSDAIYRVVLLGDCGTSFLSQTAVLDINDVLPVDLVFFHAMRVGDRVELGWETHSEWQNAHFLIDHGTDGLTWRTIDLIEGHGTTTERHIYGAVHPNPGPRVNYYRLRQVDEDGTVHIEGIRTVTIRSEGRGEPVIRLRPVPVQDVLLISMDGGAGAVLEVVDATGRVVCSVQLREGAGRVDVSELAAGRYEVVWRETGDVRAAARFVRRE